MSPRNYDMFWKGSISINFDQNVSTREKEYSFKNCLPGCFWLNLGLLELPLKDQIIVVFELIFRIACKCPINQDSV